MADPAVGAREVLRDDSTGARLRPQLHQSLEGRLALAATARFDETPLSTLILMVSKCFPRTSARLRDTVNGRILTAATMLSALATLVKAASFGKEILVARYFGASNALDAFYVAYLLPTFFIGMITNLCIVAFVPTYIEVRESEGQHAAQRVLSSAVCLHILMLLVLSLGLALSQRWLLPLMGSGFSPTKIALVRNIFFLLLSSLLLSGLSALWRAVLNAHECFALTGIAPICIPITIAILLLVREPAWRIYALVLGSVLGVTAELAVNGYGLWRIGISLIPRWSGLDNRLQQVLVQSVPAATAAILMGSTVVVDQSMAAMLRSGDVSILNYASRMISVVLGIGATSFSIAALPTFSRLSANRDWQGVRHVLSSYTRIITIVSLPIMISLIAFSEPLVRVVYERGAFTQHTAHMVASVQSILSLELPFYPMCVLCATAVCALKRNSILLWGTVICVIVNVTLNYIFMKWFGLPGIALSTVAVYAISFLYLRTMLDRALGELEGIVANETDVVFNPAEVS